MEISHFMQISKILTDLCFTKPKTKTKNTFVKVIFRSKNLLKEYKEVFLNINGAQSERLEKGTIEFKKYFKYQFNLKLMLVLSVI